MDRLQDIRWTAGLVSLLLWSCSTSARKRAVDPVASAAGSAVVLNVVSFGARGDSSTDNSAILAAAIAALPATGGVLYFPGGTYLFERPLEWSRTANIRFVGDGARFMQDFQTSPSRLVYTGRGTSPAIHVSTNYARGWTVENLEIAYSNPNFTGSLIYIDTTAGISFSHCALGGASSGPPYVAGAEAVIQVASSEKVSFHECAIQFAQRGIWVPTCAHGTCPPPMAPKVNGANNTSLLTVTDCALDNVTRALVEIEDGGAIGSILSNNIFDNTSLVNPRFGLIVHGDGFSILGNTFTGGDRSKTPTEMYVDLYGSGDFSGNALQTASPGLRLNAGGAYHVSGNYAVGRPPLTIAGGAVSGGANTWQAEDGSPNAVDIDTGAHSTVLSLGPDIFPTPSTHSYSVHPTISSSATVGVIRYDPPFDRSTDGPVTTTPFVSLQNMRLQPQHLSTPATNSRPGLEAPLATPTVPARALDADGKGVRFELWGSTAATPGRKRLRILFGPTLLYDTGRLASRGAPWVLRGEIRRAGAAREECFVEGTFDGVTVPFHVVSASADLSLDVVLSVLATGAAANDITLSGLALEPIQ